MQKIFFYLITCIVLIACVLFVLSFFYPQTLEIVSVSLMATPRPTPFVFDALGGFERMRDDLIARKASFIEVNLSAMHTRLWKEGIPQNDLPLAAKGDPQEWGGSAAGLYHVLSKSKLAFSGIAKVYMPWAVRFYGKYFIHGEPYYPGGNRRITSVTGGCVQAKDQDAKNVFEFAQPGTPVLVIDREKDNYHYQNRNLSSFPAISAKSYLVADLDSGYVFAAKDMAVKHPIASITKLMTALVVSEHIDLRKSIQVQQSMLDAYGSTKGLTVGKRFRIVELFYPLLTESSNDAAEVISGFLGREQTIQLMNEKAKAIMMEDTQFVDPHGYDQQNVSTAKDLFYLARYISNNRPPLWGITKGDKVGTFGEVRFQGLDNKNIFLATQNFIGGKAGFTKAAQYTGIFLFRLQALDGTQRRVAVILLGVEGFSEGLAKEPSLIISWLQNNYFQKTEESVVETTHVQ